MKVILTRDYEKLGYTGDMVTVKDGFAKNFLLPNNIVLEATKGNIKQMEIVKKSLIKKEAKNVAEAEQILSVVDGLLLKFKVNSSPEGKLYGSITNKDLAEKILDLKKVEIDRKKIELDEHIKEVGLYDVVIKLYKEVKATVKVEVKSDDVVIAVDGQDLASAGNITAEGEKAEPVKETEAENNGNPADVEVVDDLQEGISEEIEKED